MSTKLTYKHTLSACCIGFVSQAIVNSLAPLLFSIFQTRFALSLEAIGRLILLNFGVQLLTDALCIRFARRIRHRPMMILAHLLCAAGLALMALLPGRVGSPMLALSAAVVVYAVGGGLLEVLVSPIADALPGDAKAGAMSLLHAFYCWGCVGVVLLTTLALLLLGEANWRVLPLLWAAVPVANALFFACVPMPPALSAHQSVPAAKLLGSGTLVLAVLMMACSGAAEQSMSQWASLFAERGLRVPKAMGDLLGPCLFSVLMGTGRTFFGLRGGRLRLRRALMLCAVLCVACYLTAALSPGALPALIACAVTGFAVSLMWPGMLSLSSARFPGAGTALFGLLALGGDVGCSIGPWLTGAVSDWAQTVQPLVSLGASFGLDATQTGLKAGLLVAVIFPIGLLLGLWRMRREER